MPTLISRAYAASVDGSNVPSWIRLSSATSRFTEPGSPYGSTSRATKGRSVSPGVTGSIVLPHRYAAKSAPGISSTRVSLPSRSSAAAASSQYAGTSSGRDTPVERNPTLHTGARAANASSPTNTPPASSGLGHGGAFHRMRVAVTVASAPTPAASSPASPSTMTGATRGGVAQREPGRRVVRERLEHASVDAGIVVRPRTDADDRADHDEQREDRPGAATARRRPRRAPRTGIAKLATTTPRLNTYVPRLVDREAEPVEPVEEPVADPAEQVGGVRRRRRRCGGSR